MADPVPYTATNPIQPLGLQGPGTVPVPNIETRTEADYFKDLTTPTGTKPIIAGAGAPAPADPFAEFADAPAESFDQFQDAPDQFAGFETADDLDVRSTDELNADREKFDPVAYFASNPDAANDPAKLKKLLDVYRKRREEGLTAGGVIKAAVKETPGLVGDIVGGAKRLVERGIDVFIQPTANVVLGTLTGDLFDKQKRDALFNETRKVVKKGVAEVSAGSESATVGLVDLTRTGLRKIPAGKTTSIPDDLPRTRVGRVEISAPKPKTDQELLQDISDDASFRQNAEEILTGQGEAAKNFGLDKETLAKEGIELDEKAIQQLSLVDPITMVATGGAFKLVGAAGKVLGTATTLKGVQYAAGKLADIAKYSSGKTIQVAGTATKIVGKGLQGAGGTAALIAGVGSAVRGAGTVEALAVSAATKAIGPVVRKTGELAEHFGKAIAGEVPISATAQKLLDYAAIPAGASKTVVKGAATGIAAGAPFAIAADSDEQAGALLGAGAALGAGHAAVAGSFRVVKNSAARRYFGENRPVLEDVPSPAYGKEAALDATHEAQMQKLSLQDASEINNFREILRPHGGEFYTLDRASWRKEMERVFPDITPEQLDIYENHSAFFDEAKGPDRRVVYLNADATGLKHDAGHIFDALLSPEKRTELRTAVKDTFGQKSIDDFKEGYQRKVGNKISDKAALDEFIAEQFNALFYNVPVTELNAPKSLLNKFIDTVAEGAEVLGIDIGKGKTTPNLGAPVSVGIRKLFQNAAGEVTRRNVEATPPNVTPLPPTPPPAPAGPGPVAPPTNIVPLTPPPSNVVPLAPSPGSRNIRVTPEQVAAFKQSASPDIRAQADARAKETGVEYARTEAKKADGSPTSQIIERISDSMESGAPVVGIEHLGITSESTPAAPTGRTPRRAEQASGYAALEAAQLDVRQNAPPEIVAQHSKNFVPVRWTDQGGTPTLIAMSLDKVISNILKIAADPKAKDLIPYAVENGKLTPEGWREVVADAQAYSENQSNGRKGDGGRLEVPEAGLSIPAENPAYTPQTLTPERANFQNLVQGLAPPQTSRASKGVMPGNVKGQILAEANRRPVELPANIPAKQAGKQAFVEFPPRVVQEVNPLRNAMEKAGVKTRDLLEVTERIRAKDIVSATPKPDISYKAPVTDIIRGGFLPSPTEFRTKNLGGRTVEEFSDYVVKSSPEEWKAATEKMIGGLTGGAWNLGLGLTDRADLVRLKLFQDTISESTKAAMKSGDFDSAYSLVSKGQFFREAYEAATGTGSAGSAFKKGLAGMESAKPPFPIEAATTESTSAGGRGTTTTETAGFLPAVEKAVDSVSKELSPRSLGALMATLGGLFDSGGAIRQLGKTTVDKLSGILDVIKSGLNLYESPYETSERKGELVTNPKTGKKETSVEQLSRIYNQLTIELDEAVGPSFKTPEPFEQQQARARAKLNYDMSPAATRIEFLSEFAKAKAEQMKTPEREGLFQPAEQLDVGTIEESPELRIVPRGAAAGGTPPIEPPGPGLVPPPIVAGKFQPAEQIIPQEDETPDLRVVPAAAGAGGTPPIEPPGRGLIPPPVAAKEDKESAKFLPTPSTEIQDIAKKYADDNGIEYAPTGGYAELKPDLSKRLAKFYNDAKSDPTNPEVAASYDALIRETEEQGKAILAAGYKIEPWMGAGEPYKDSASAIADVRDNKHLFFRKTSDSFGAGESNVGNPMLAESNLVPGQSANDVFRWVHDFFGHSKEGFQFGPRGEFNAWRAHSEMYSPDAQGALASETLAQNSWVNFGPQLEGKNIPLAERPFAEQKNLVVPPELIAEAGRFQPRTESGRKLEEKGYEIVSSGEMGVRRVTIRSPEGEDIAQIQSVQRSPKKAEIAFVNKLKGAPSGLGEVLYREVGAQLKQDGVKLIGGQVVSPEPLAIRKKIFGGFKTLDVNAEPATYEQALAIAERLQGRTENEVAAIEPVNEITAKTKFLPGKRDAQGRPLDKEGNIDYAKWQAESVAANRKRIAEPIAKSVPKGKVSVDLGTATGWVLPNKEFVPLDAAFHEQYLANNAADLNKKFKTKFSETPSVDDRLDALNAGFVRLRNQGGAMRVEANAERWASLKSTVLDTLRDRESKIDGLTVSLLNRRGQQVDSASAPRLQELSGPEKMNAIEEAVNSLRSGGGAFLPKGEYWMDKDGEFIPAPKGHFRAAEELLNLSDLSSEDAYNKMFEKGYSRVISGDESFYVESPKDRLSDLNSVQRSAIEDEVLKRGQELTFNGRRIGGSFQPAEGGLPGIGIQTKEEAGRAKAARRIATVKKNNPEAVTPQYARDETGEIIVTPDGTPKPLTLDYDFINSPLAKEAAKGLKGVKREEAAAEAIGNKLVDFYREAEKNPDLKAGSKWYSTARTRLRGVFGDDSKFFAELLGATSARTPVATNYRFALDAYNQFKAGAFDKTLAKYREGKAAWDAQELGDFKGETRGQFMDFWVTEHNLGVTQASGKKYGMNSRAVLRVLDGSWASEVVGPKTPNFAGNLTGESFRATIDVWAGRTLHRLANEGRKDRWRILPENETGINDRDFYFGQAAYEVAAKKLGVKADSVQSVLWFAEKRHWEDRGWTRGAGAELSDFNILLKETEKTPTGMKMKTPQMGLDFEANVDDLKKKR